MEEEEYEEVVEYYIEETVIEEGEPHEVVTEITETISTDYSVPETTSTDYSVPETTTTTTYTAEHTQPSREDAAPPIRKKTIRTKVDPSKFLTPYLEHSNKMKDLFSENKYKEKFRKEKGKPYASTVDTPEIRRIKKVQDQLSEVKYRMAGEVARTICHVDEKAMDIEHAKKVSQQVSKVLYKQNWEENKDKYLLPPDAPELVNAIKNTALFSKKLYTEDWDADKTLFYPYNDSPELRRVAQAQKTLSDIVYKKGHDERKAKFTSLPDPPDVEQAKKVTRQLSDVIYHEDYKNKIKGKWSQTPCYDVAVAKMNAENLSMRKYQEDFENMKDQIYFMQTETPEYEANKRASENISKFKYRADYEKKKAVADYNVLPATENPLLKQLKTAGNILSDKLYKEAYEQSKGNKMNYCETPKFQTDAALKNFSDIKYKDAYQKNILGHYLGSFEDPHQIHCMKVEAMKSDKNYKADYEEEKTKCYFPQTITQEYEAIKKLEQCKDYTYKKHPDQTKFTSVTDSPVQKQAEINSKQLSDILYKSKGEEIIHKYHLPPDVPQFIQARVNAYNISDANYKADWKKTLAKGYDLKPDAIPIIAAKASRNIASDYKYKESYEKDKGKQVGYRSLQDDPKLVHYMNVAKIQSDREYKKDYEVTKTKYHTPLDMFSVTAAKKAQEVVTNTGYKQPIHHYTLLPDSVNLELSRNVMQLQSDNLYKSDFNNWLRGVGWVPIQSLDVEKAKKATEILSEKKYRQHPDQLKFSIPMDAMEQVLAKQNAKTMNKRLYTDKWNKEKTSIHVMPDTPEILQCKVNQMTMSDKLYKAGWEEDKKKGYDLQPDAIPIKAAKSSRDIASDYKYKLAYEKAKGKHIGFRSLEDDPKLVHFMQVAKMQSDREYKKGYEKAKTNFHTPVDMVSVVAAKKAQEVATNANYKNLIHTYNVLPDAMSIELAKNMMQLQSDNQYKAEYDETMKGVGWLPLGSLEAEKNKKAMEIVSEKKYRQHPDKLKYSVPMDSMNMVLALNNAKIMDEHKYKQAWEEDKKKIHITPDIPQIALAKANAFNLSEKMYRSSFEETRKKGYDLRADAIPVKAAKASRDIASDYKYKLGYEKDKGKLVGFRSLQDDPKLVHCMQVAKMQSDREYKKAYEASKTHYQTPSDTLSVVAAKEAQDRVTNTNYKRLIHQYMLLPDAMSLELYRNMNQIQSDNEYKQDYKEWFRGIGWSPIGSLDVEKSKKATEIASDRKYRQHPSKFPFTKQNDAMDLVLAKQNANIMNKHAYTQAWEKDKTQVHVMPDTPDILQAKQNKTNYSQKLYKLDWEKMIKKGYDLTPEAMSVKAAKASRDIASDFKYKEGYRKQQGHHIGFRSLQDDPKMLWSMQVAKMQSEREYKKDFEKWKTKFNMPVDMLGFLLAKKCQELVSDVDYKHILHRWTCLPDQVDVTEAKRVNELQSENLYKSDLQWLRGIGWSPLGSLEAEKNKKASEILSDKKYRQHPDTIKFTSIPDAMDVVLAKSNAKNRSDILYREAWNKDKTKVHIMPDTPEILLAKSNLINTSDKRYKVGYEELRKKGYDLPPDAIPLQAAKASRDIASEYKYKTAYRKQLGHHIGARNIEDDPKMMWSMHVAKIQSDREYKKDFEKSKTRFSSPVDMLGVVLAKKCQELVSDADYRHPLHRWTCLPDQNDVVHAKTVYDLQSDNVYKSDLQWLRGIGWSPIGSLDVEKNKRASEILSDKKYRQHPDTIKFTSLPDSMPMVLAKNNSKIMDQRSYISAWEKDKTSIHIMPDTPGILLAQQNKVNFSEKLYKQAMEEEKKKGYDMRADAIPIKSAKASRDIASDYKYKEGYRKQLGHHIGARNIEDDPKMMWSMHVAKIQSDREYKKAFEKSKTNFSSPVDMLGVVLAKKCQELVSDADYRHPLHRWTCLPDQNDVVHAKTVYDLQSDNVYKSDLQWLRGIGWSPIGSLDAEKNKRASEILSDKKYRQHPGTIKFTSLPDSMPMVLAKNNSKIMDQRSYISAWEKDKTSIHIMPDTPGILLAQQNKVNFSEKLYKQAMEEEKKKGYDMRADAIPIKSAKASRDIASDYKYKEGYRKQLGHHIGARNIEDDPKMMWSMHVAKIQSDREYKKAFEKSKTNFSSPVDMLGVVLAKKCQELVSDVDYRHPLHRWTCLPDQNDVVHAKTVYDLQSDNVYKSDLQWLRGIGWSPIGSLDVEKNKRASEILSDKKYRQHPDTIKFTSLPDSMPMVLAKNNSKIMDQRSYISAWEKDKTSIHIMPDTPGILLAQQNKVNFSEKLYKQAMEEEKKKGYDMRADAIPIKSAKASRDIASDYKYKEGYRKQLGHHIGARNIEDDPKMMWSMHVAKIQSDREYKKAFEKSKTNFSSPVDMLGVVLAKKCQELVSDVDYRHPLHRWTCLPDQNDVVHAKTVYDLQSDNVYKSDLQWLRGIGWSPIGSLDVEKNKRASEILSDKKYRQHPDTIKFTSLPDSMPMVLAKHNSEIMNQRSYISAWEKDKTSIHIMPDTPGILLAQQNKVNFSEKLYKQAMEEEKKKGYDMRADAIPIKSAKASRDIASDYKYKEGYRKQLGHHIGARNIEDDPKMMWSMHVAKIQSDREYKKDFEKSKTRFSSPVDMLGVVLAKKCQELVSDADYRHYLHEWTCLPDQNDVIHAKQAYDLQSDNCYKSDLEWLRGIGWVPIGSLEVEKAKKAGEILSDKIYRQHPDTIKFTSIPDSLPMVLAKQNADTMNKRLYTEAWDKDKTQIHIMPDTPEITLARENKKNYSLKQYRQAMEDAKKKGYDLRADAIPIQAAKASRQIASDYKYKEGYRKQLGHHIGARNIEDDPKMMWSMHVAKIQSDREYKKDFEKSKTRFSSPVDMLGIVLAKKCQGLVSDIDYRHYLHQWICLPDQNDVIHAKEAYDLQSDHCYKSDLEWLRGIGWVPIGSLEVEKAKKAGEILSDKIYRQRPDTIKFTSVTDSLEMVLAKQNADTMNKRLYTEAWNKDKTTIHVMPDTPEILLAKQNRVNYSEKMYKLALEESKKKGYDLRFDAIPIQSAKASREIASEYKYKEGYRKQLGHHIGARNIEDDPKMMWSMHVAKIQSDREYKKDFEKSKTRFSSPVDMLGIVLAKKCQQLVSDADYRHYLHQWICLPDQNDVIHAKQAYELQSDNFYKSDLEWLRGIGWVPIGSLEVEKAKKAGEILSDKIYRQRPDTIKFTSVTDSLEMVLAKQNADTMNKRLYTEAWNKDKTTIHVMPDTPEILLAKQNRVNYSEKMYKLALEESKKKGYDLRFDAIPIQSAKASREIASEYKYKEGYRKQLGHHIGARNIEDDPKMMWSMHVAKIQSDREYKKDFEKSKTRFSSPVDMLGIVLAKKCQQLVSDADYRHYLHQWICLPDQNDVIHAKEAYDLQSDAVYKSDLEWLRGIGWVPIGSLEVEKAKKAGEILSDRKYRQPADKIKFTSVTDSLAMVLAKQNAEIMNKRLYTEAWDADKKTIHVMPDTPDILLAKANAANVSNKLYVQAWEEAKKKGYDMRADAIPIKTAKASRDIASDYKYKETHEKEKGHYIGCPSAKDDPKLALAARAMALQNDRLYKKAYNDSKTQIHIPVDALSVQAAKECQTLVSDIDYRQYLHQWTCLPDQNDVIHARQAYDLQSDNVYKADLEWLRGCGWIPLDSVEHKKVKNAQELINKRAYTKEAVENFSKYTTVVDTPEITLAKMNSVNQSDLKYKETFNQEKGQYIGSDDTPALHHAKDMSLLHSEKHYKKAWELSKPIGYTLDEKYVPLVGAKHANHINSELKYKEIYEKLKGHYLAGKDIGDFPSVTHSLEFQKMRSALAYRKNYEDTKKNVHIPADMMNHVLAKKCQYILSDLEYRTYFHQWSCSPEENDVIHARKAQEILSDSVYKDDLNWLKGLGCYVWDTPQILQAKKSYDLQSQIKYTSAGKENFQNFSVVTDTPVYVTALQSAANASEVKYKEEFHKTKDKYTTVPDSVDSERVQSLKHLYSDNLYKKAWDKVKATSYALPSDTVALARAKELKHNASIVKYREEYDKFKALYTLPRGVEDDPNTERCLRVGKLNIDRLYKEAYEKTKAKVHIVPDMMDIISAKDAQKKVSEVDYRTRLHEWLCLPDLQVNTHVRRVTDQVSDVIYKDDLNWLKGIGCFVWDTPEILHAKQAYDLRSDIKYKSKAEKMKKDFTVVTDTPVYVQNVISALNLSEAVYRGDYKKNVQGKMIPTDKTVDLERAYNANKIQSENLYRWAGVNALPTGYSLPTDTPNFQHAKHVQHIGSDLKYKEAYEHMKAKGYTLGPKDVGFENVRKVNQVINERLYRATYHKNKDKIHTTPDTPELRQVRATQEAVSDLIYKSDFFKMQGHLISLPYTPEVLHCRYVGDITSDNKYKEDLRWLKGLGCFLYDTPDMVRARELRKLWSNYVYTSTAKKMWPKIQVVLDTPEYRAVQELKTHLSELVYRAAGNELKTKYTSILDTPDLIRAKTGQKIQSQYLYVELATKERPHHHADGQTQAFAHARTVKDMISEKKYKNQYEKMKHKYTPIPDTPVLIRAKRAYLNASDLRYKETFENTKGKYHTVKDALDIVYHRKVTDDISSVKYKENYMSQLGIWRSIPDRPEHFHHRLVTDAISDVKYKEDLEWLKGTGCYVWDTPSFVLAEQNKVLYSGCKYKENFEKTKSKFKYVADSPINEHFKYATQLMDGKSYKSFAKMLLQHGCNEILRPDMLTALYNTYLWSQIQYKKDYEKKKDKYTTVLDTPEYLRTTKVNKQISDIIYKLEYNKAKPKGYTTIQDTPMLLHVRKVKDRISDLKYKEMYERSKSRCNVVADSVHIKTPRHAYKLNSNLDYKKKYEAAKAHWHLIADRPDFVQAAKSSLQQSDYEYKLDREFLKGCKLSVTDDKNTVLALNNAILASDIKYKEKHNKARGTYHVVPDTPQILLAKNVSSLVSENKYKEQSKKQLPHGSFTTLPETRDTVHVKEVTKNVSETNYKKKFVKEKGKSNYSVMLEPPEVKHAMEVAKNQSTIEYKKDAKSKLHYTPIADRPDIKKATQAAKLISNIEYKKRGAAGVGVTMLGRPDIELAKEVSKLTSQAEYLKQHMRGHGAASYDTPWMRTFKKANMLSSHVKYKENFAKELGKKPKYDLKEAKIYKTLKDAHNMASEVKYKADLKKLHKPVTDMKESLLMNHVLSTSQLASAYQYKKQYEKSKGHYHVVPDNLEQVHLREASELQSHVKYREKYEKEKGKPMLDFETPTYLTAKESQLMQSEKEYKKDFEESMKGRNLTGLEVTPSLLHVKYATKIASEKEYRKDLEEGVKGKGLTALEETPEMLRAKNATQILNEKEYKRALEQEIRGKGLTELALETPDFVRARNATDIASQIKYKQLAEMEKANYTSVVDTPEIIHAQQVKNLSSQKKYKEDAEKNMPYYVPVADTPEMQRVRENQKNFSMLQYQSDLQNSKGKVTVVQDTPEILRVKENQKNFSSILYKEDIGTGTTIEKTPEMQRVKRTQDNISSVKYKESIGKGTPIPDLPEVKRVKETQKHISSVLYKEELGTGTPTPVTPEMERVKRNQEQISSVLYKEGLGAGTATPVTPEMERVRRNQEHISSVLYKEGLGVGTPVPVTPEMERVKRNQENFSSVLYKEELGTGTPTPVTPEIERVKRNQENFSSVLYKEELGTGTPTPVTPEIERVKRNQENFSSVLYKEELGTGTPTPVTPEIERVKRNQENFSSVLYREELGTGTPIPVTPELERARRNQEHLSSVLYKESVGTGTPTPVTPEMERVKRNQEICSSVLYKENIGKATPTPVTPEMERVKRNQEIISSVLYKENVGKVTPTPITPEMERVKRNQEIISSVLYKENVGQATPTPVTPEMERVKRTQEQISSVAYREGLGKATPSPITPEMERVKRNQEQISSVLYKEHMAKGTPTPLTPEMERAKRNQENISSVLYSDSFRKQVQGKAAYVLDTPEMRRVRETQKHISTVKYHEDFEKSKGSFTPVVTDPITERVKKNMQDFSDISYRGIQRRVVEMERKRVDQDQENLTGLRVWRTNPGSVFDYDPAEDNIQSRSLHMISVQAQRRSREHSRSASALSISGAPDEKSEPSDGTDQRLSYYSNGGFFTTTATVGYKQVKTIELPQQRSSSVATQQTTVSSVPSHPSTAGKTFRAMYDYTAADADEVSFKDGDTIVNVQAIDEGWMYGTVQRTGKTGMLPANYVEAV
ncbi:nebulin isoform X30 [Taeniopygia guttata]|uniref:nebulin isoform X30 n=1 Tax=Taeniopygia guttata TaxID=59729 RepID=UPI003BB86FBA